MILVCLGLLGFASAQSVNYRGAKVDTLRIRSHWSAYQFDSSGTTLGLEDEIMLVHDAATGRYVMASWRSVSEWARFQPRGQTSMGNPRHWPRHVDADLLAALLRECEKPYVRPTPDNIGLSQKRFLQLTDLKHVMDCVAAQEVEDGYWVSKSAKSQLRTFAEGCQQRDTFDLYLATQFDTSAKELVTDNAMSLEISVTTSQGYFIWEGAYPQPYFQPWHLGTERGGWPTAPHLNFAINTALMDILPKDFLQREKLGVEALVEDYVRWYLHRQDRYSFFY